MYIQIMALLLTSAGIYFLSRGILNTLRIRHEAKDTRSRWTLLLILICLFVAGYLGFICQMPFIPPSPTEFMVATVFLGGGVFVSLVTGLSLSTIQQVKRLAIIEADNERIRAMKHRIETILNSVAEGIVTFDNKGKILSLNKAGEELFGTKEDKTIGRPITEFIRFLGSGKDCTKGPEADFFHCLKNMVDTEAEAIGITKEGAEFPMALKVRVTDLDGIPCLTALVSDITERKAYIDKLTFMAERDPLTGLYNRKYFLEELNRLVERAKRSKKACGAILYIDLDRFKYVNDTLGHCAGDRLLIEIAGLLSNRTRKGDVLARMANGMVSRFGGDEFTVLLYDCDEEGVRSAAQSFHKKIADYSFSHEGRVVNIGCSMGVAIIDASCDNAEEVLSRADYACHLAKKAGRNTVKIFSSRNAKEIMTVKEDIGWAQKIKEALKHGGFRFALQPIVSVKNLEIYASEVLLRMEDTNGEIIMPGGFLPAAERFGHMKELDIWVIRHAVPILSDPERSKRLKRLSINLSVHSLDDLEVLEVIKETIKTNGVKASDLIFEVTETAAITDIMNVKRFLTQLKRLGCWTSVDDFGAGFSSFTYLRQLPVDIVKIDGNLVRFSKEKGLDRAIVKAVNDIAHTLGKQTVAEFVEEEAILKELKELEVDYAQGYFTGRPELI